MSRCWRVRRRRRIDRVMQPAVPARRRRRGFGDAVIDHPAPLEAERRIDRSAARAVVGVAELIVTDEFALTPRIEERVEGRAVPPREEPQEKVFDLHESRLPGPGLEGDASAQDYEEAHAACPAELFRNSAEIGLAGPARLGGCCQAVSALTSCYTLLSTICCVGGCVALQTVDTADIKS